MLLMPIVLFARRITSPLTLSLRADYLDDGGASVIRKNLNIMRSTVLEGSFGVEKNNYSLDKIKARTKKNEILWIVFGIHTANFCRLANRKLEEIKLKKKRKAESLKRAG